MHLKPTPQHLNWCYGTSNLNTLSETSRTLPKVHQFFIKPHNLMISWLFSPNWCFTLTTPTIQRFMCSLHKTFTKGASILLAKVLESNYQWLQGKDIPDFLDFSSSFFFLFFLLLALLGSPWLFSSPKT